MFINWKLREINLKIVYYGPSLSGKTSSLEYIHSRTHPDRRGELISLKTREDRTLYFDYMQFQMGEIGGLKPRFNIYTVPGQVYYRGTRKLVLKGVDGIVFVADSQINRLDENLEAIKDLYEDLKELGFEPKDIPFVLQCNKRDLPEIVPVQTLKEHLGLNGIPTYESVAVDGVGVLDGLKSIVNNVVTNARGKINPDPA
ncbi:MAG: gliding-motility protein MglA [Chloroflexota bacterium]|nr:MAG: gliding-motility protein MglA [Chloroflexota bacterium]